MTRATKRRSPVFGPRGRRSWLYRARTPLQTWMTEAQIGVESSSLLSGQFEGQTFWM